MKRIKSVLLLILALAVSVAVGDGNALAGKIVVANDEWTLSDSGFGGSNDPGAFAANVASWFTGGGAGSFLAYSNNFGLTGGSLAAAMTGAGHTWTVSTAPAFDLTTLAAYDGVFLAGDAADNNVLIDYVLGGGNVYLAGGTGLGGAAAEAARWNTFLNYFGLGFASEYNGVGGNIAISSAHPIFNGVDSLYQFNGNSVLDILPADPAGAVLVAFNGQGLYAVYESAPAGVPEPATMLLLGLGLSLVAFCGRRRFK